LLDEPTNHLDITSQEVLQEAMAQYEGTIIVVSHNRFFVNSFVNKVLEIRDGRATLYLGNVDDYLAARKRLEEDSGRKEKAAARDAGKGSVTDSGDRKAQRRERAKLRNQLSGKLKPWKKQVAESEKKIGLLEEQKSGLEEQMADPDLYADQQRWAETSKTYSDVQRQLERLYDQWEQAQEKIEEIEAQIHS